MDKRYDIRVSTETHQKLMGMGSKVVRAFLDALKPELATLVRGTDESDEPEPAEETTKDATKTITAAPLPSLAVYEKTSEPSFPSGKRLTKTSIEAMVARNEDKLKQQKEDKAKDPDAKPAISVPQAWTDPKSIVGQLRKTPNNTPEQRRAEYIKQQAKE